jgi:hypothetical protein
MTFKKHEIYEIYSAQIIMIQRQSQIISCDGEVTQFEAKNHHQMNDVKSIYIQQKLDRPA